jgi:hypothetical protein
METEMMTLNEYLGIVMPKMEGWCTEEKAKKIAEVVSPSQVQVFVELGVFAGRSLFAAAIAIKGHGIAIGIDPWDADESIKGFDDENKDWWGNLDHSRIYDKCRETQDQLGVTDNCYLIRSNSKQALPLIQKAAPLDVVHVDGNHSPEASMFDVSVYVPLVRTGGVVIFDDMDWKTTQGAQAYLHSTCTLFDTVGSCGFFRKTS